MAIDDYGGLNQIKGDIKCAMSSAMDSATVVAEKEDLTKAK